MSSRRTDSHSSAQQQHQLQPRRKINKGAPSRTHPTNSNTSHNDQILRSSNPELSVGPHDSHVVSHSSPVSQSPEPNLEHEPYNYPNRTFAGPGPGNELVFQSPNPSLNYEPTFCMIPLYHKHDHMAQVPIPGPDPTPYREPSPPSDHTTKTSTTGKAPSCLRLAEHVGQREIANGSSSNFVISPVSFHAALALVVAGAAGETMRQLLDFLGFESLADLHNAAITQLVGSLHALSQTHFACGIWIDRSNVLKPEFTETAASLYSAVAESVDFSSQAQEVRRRVNDFVKKETNGLIQDLIPPSSVSADTVAILANALYFKGTWAEMFDRSSTTIDAFHLLDGTKVYTRFMTSKEDQLVACFDGFKVLKLPYENYGPQGRFHMLIFLPDNRYGISDLYHAAISSPDFVRQHTPYREIKLGKFMIPKFKFSFEFEAIEDLQTLGLTDPFCSGADFSGMFLSGKGTQISKVHHKATVELDEDGTVASAATAVCMLRCAFISLGTCFVADHPFLFAIVEDGTGAVLFFGHVVNPVA